MVPYHFRIIINLTVGGGNMLPKKGKKLPSELRGLDGDDNFRQAVAIALANELGATHQATKTVMQWTGASERTVKHWFAATHSPSGHHLAAISRHSDAVLMCFLLAAGRSHLSVGMRWASIRPMLVDLLAEMDTYST